ncbi:hypothetical protein OEZ86_012207 [Tetradesmus obliquus]|nr:hypothetical protein OEZ86_012207 [Tetradesmus obliquus]
MLQQLLPAKQHQVVPGIALIMDTCAWQQLQALAYVVTNSLCKYPRAVSMLLCTSKDLAVAAQLPRLVQLNVTLTGITRDACSSLQDSRPGLKVLARRPALAAPTVLTLWGDPPEPSPQKPRGAYMWFCKRARPAVMLAYPDWGSAIVGKELCRLWSAASSAEKQRYERLADADKASYEQVPLKSHGCMRLAAGTAITAAAQLGTMHAAAGLTKLQLRDCELEDDMLLVVVRGRPALQRLDVSRNLLLTDAALTAVAAQLPQLVELDVTLTSITRDACSSLQDSRPGLKISAGRTRNSMAAKVGSPATQPEAACGAYTWFCKRVRPALKLAHPYWGVTEMGLEIGDLWVAASSAEKQHYQRVAYADKASYEQEMAFLRQVEERRQPSVAGKNGGSIARIAPRNHD